MCVSECVTLEDFASTLRIYSLQCGALRALYLQDNSLSGTIPEGMSASTALT
jgi:hypothetical protein